MKEKQNIDEVAENGKIKIGIMIKDAREAKNMSMNALAKVTGVTQPTIYNIENGLRWTYIPIYMKICHALDLRLSDLLVFLDGEDDLNAEEALLMADMRRALLRQRQLKQFITENNQ